MWDEAASGFLFELGAVVEHKSKRPGKGASTTRFVVVQRSLVQCHGGIQRHYECRGVIEPDFGHTAGVIVSEFSEVELRAAKEE